MTKYLQSIHHQLTLNGEPIIDPCDNCGTTQTSTPSTHSQIRIFFFSSNLGDGAFSYVLQWIIYLILVL